MKTVLFATASPRRRELCALLPLRAEFAEPRCAETLDPGASPAENALRLARQKAASRFDGGRTVVGCDTLVVSPDGEILGKPKDEADARRMLRALSGREHRVVSGVCILSPVGEACFTEETAVWFRDLTDEEIETYVAGKEPMDKAGSYGIQGRGALFVRRIEGDYFNVVGLPLCRLNTELDKLLRRL